MLQKLSNYNMVIKSEFYRMLKPSEVKSIESNINKIIYKMSFKTAFYTGMRFKELRDFANHPEWHNFKRAIILIPKSFTKTNNERKINLTPTFNELLFYFLQSNKLKYSSYQAWSADLRRWAKMSGIDHPEDLSAGTSRKTWESWLIESGFNINKILASQGHTMNVSIVHYYNNDVSVEERIDIKKETLGWM